MNHLYAEELQEPNSLFQVLRLQMWTTMPDVFKYVGSRNRAEEFTSNVNILYQPNYYLSPGSFFIYYEISMCQIFCFFHQPSSQDI